MNKTDILQAFIFMIVGSAGALMVDLFGGWDMMMEALLILMGLDFFTGFIAAFVFKQSKKTENGRAESHAMIKGLVRKIMLLCMVIVGCLLDELAESNQLIRNMVIIALASGEVLSFIENIGLMGVPVPNALKEGLEVLYKRAEQKEGKKK